MRVLQLTDGSIEIVDNYDSLYELVRDRMGEDASDMILDLISESDYTNKKLDSDLISYESSLDSYNSMCFELKESIEKLQDYVRDAKRLDRNKLLESLEHLIDTIENADV